VKTLAILLVTAFLASCTLSEVRERIEPWNPSFTYAKGSLVSTGEIWVSQWESKTDSNRGNAPLESEFWTLFSKIK